jgi:cytoskeletal protein CcmA (bactofilin family)
MDVRKKITLLLLIAANLSAFSALEVEVVEEQQKISEKYKYPTLKEVTSTAIPNPNIELALPTTPTTDSTTQNVNSTPIFSGTISNSGLWVETSTNEKTEEVDAQNNSNFDDGSSGNDGYGIAIINPTLALGYTNNGNISNLGKNDFGVMLQALDENLNFTNDGIIDATEGYAMAATSIGNGNVTAKNTGTVKGAVIAKTVLQQGVVTINNSGNIEGNFIATTDADLSSPNVSIVNNGTVTGRMMAQNNSSATATNNKNGIITGDVDYAMIATNGAYVTNNGTISTNGDYGVVSVKALNGVLPAEGINEGTIANSGNYGMAAFNHASSWNYGTIKNGKSVGMLATGSGTIGYNVGTITNSGDIGMLSLDTAGVYNMGTIKNGGNIGMYVGTNALGNNAGTIENEGNVGVYNDGYFVNSGTINPLSKAGADKLYAVITGKGNATIVFVNPGNNGYTPITNSEAVFYNTGGNDVIQFGAESSGVTSSVNLTGAYYNYAVGSGWIRGMSATSYAQSLNKWTINGNHTLIGSNGLANADAELNSAILSSNKEILDTDITLGSSSNIVFIMGRDKKGNGETYLASPIVYANIYNPLTGQHNNLVLNSSFMTTADEIKFPIAVVNETVGLWKVPTSGTQKYTIEEGEANKMTATKKAGWTAHYEFADDGTLSLVYVRDPESKVAKKKNNTVVKKETYPRSTVTTTNAKNIVHRTYSQTRKAILEKPVEHRIVHTERKEKVAVQKHIIPPVKLEEDNSKFLVGTEGIKNIGNNTENTVPANAPTQNIPVRNVAITEKGKEIIVPPVIEEVEIPEEIPVMITYNNLQFAEVFGDWGKYSGDNAYDYDTFGVTGSTFHKFEKYPEWMVGLSYGYAYSKVDYSDTFGSKEKVDTLALHGIVAWARDNWLVTGTVGHSWSRQDLTRKFLDYDLPYLMGSSDISPVKRQADKKFNAHQWSVGFESGYNFDITPTFTIFPYVGFEYLWEDTDGYTENYDGWANREAISGSMTVDKYTLKVDKNVYNTGIIKAGIMAKKIYNRWLLACDLSWNYYTSNYKPITGKYVDALDRGEQVHFESERFNVGRNAGYVDINVEYAINDQWAVGVEYATYFRKNLYGQLAGATVTYKF